METGHIHMEDKRMLSAKFEEISIKYVCRSRRRPFIWFCDFTPVFVQNSTRTKSQKTGIVTDVSDTKRNKVEMILCL